MTTRLCGDGFRAGEDVDVTVERVKLQTGVVLGTRHVGHAPALAGDDGTDTASAVLDDTHVLVRSVPSATVLDISTGVVTAPASDVLGVRIGRPSR